MMDGSVVMANAPTMQDCIAMMEDIIAVFQGGDDIVTVDEIREKGEMIRCETGKREENLEDLTSKLRESVNAAEKELSAAEPDEVHQQRVAELETTKKNIIRNIMQLEEECSAQETKLIALQSEAQKAAEDHAELLDQLRDDVPRRKNIRSLYAAITNIRLHSKPSRGDKITGYVALSNPPALRPFEYEDNNAYEKVNDLWKLIVP